MILYIVWYNCGFSDNNCIDFILDGILNRTHYAQAVLNDLVAVEPQQATCILSHEFPGDLGTFHGTEDGKFIIYWSQNILSFL